MGRPKRLDFPGAIHHVTNRGVREMDIFLDQEHRQKFLDLMVVTKQVYGFQYFAWALMDNHFHIALCSLRGRISDGMCYLQSEYAKWFNKARGREKQGHLFQERFHNALIQKGQYFNSVIRYILLNPHRAGISEPVFLDGPCTSLTNFKRDTSIVDWEGLFERLEDVELDNFEDFLHAEHKEIQDDFESNKRTVRDLSVVGDDDFLQLMLEKKREETRAEDKRGGPVKPEIILGSVAPVYNCTVEDLINSVQDHKNSEARSTAYFLLRARAHLSLDEISDIFNLSPTTISRAINQLETEQLSKEQQTLWERWQLTSSE